MNLTSLFFLLLWSTPGDVVPSELVPRGITEKVGGYRPIRAEMDQSAEIVKQSPEDLSAPKYGMIELGDKRYAFIVEEAEEGGHKLFVDTNGDGDLTNDPAATWEATTQNDLTMYQGSAQVELPGEVLGTINLYRFDPNDPRRAALKNTVLYYSDFGYKYTLKLDDQQFETFISGAPSAEIALWLDRNQDGRPSMNYEMVSSGKPFNFTGTTYLLSVDGGQLSLEKAQTPIPQLPLPPDLRLGKDSLQFTATTMKGESIEFPKSYAGKIVMLDFWATWCGPCIGEIPNMKKAYEQWHDQGFEILGVSFDQEGMEERLTEFLAEQELPWNQIYEGKGWETTLGQQHDVSGIPFVLLVDGDSGKILGTSRELRGEGLADYVGKMLEGKRAEK